MVEALPRPGTGRAIVDGAADLQQEVGAPSCPSHLLGFIHSPVDEEIRGRFGERCSGTQAGAVTFGVIDQPVALTGKIAVQRMQGGPQFPGWRVRPAASRLPLKCMHDLLNAADADFGVFGLAVSQPPAQPFDLLDDRRLRLHPRRIIGRQCVSDLLQVLQPHRDVEPIQDRRLGDASGGQ